MSYDSNRNTTNTGPSWATELSHGSESQGFGDETQG